MNLHEIEERDFGRERIWDADPDVCCAYFQLGACVHTEGYRDDEPTDDEWDAAPVASVPAPIVDDSVEPF